MYIFTLINKSRIIIIWRLFDGGLLDVIKDITVNMWHADCVLIKYGGRSNALPPLDWPLPSQFDQYELRIEVQPRPHHRAHYETEGSRGAVKATPTGHPVVKVKYKSAATGGCRYRNRIVSKHWNKVLGDVMFLLFYSVRSCVDSLRGSRSPCRFLLEQLMTDQSGHIPSIRYTGGNTRQSIISHLWFISPFCHFLLLGTAQHSSL